ncbi:MAG TPA: CHRD domain-containing protein [Hymenobacter sp.]
MKQSYILGALAAVGLLASCSDKEDAKPAPDATIELTATIDGSQQASATAPAPTPSKATGTFTGTYTKVGNVQKLTYTVTYQGLKPTQGHIHTGAPGTSGPVTIDFEDRTLAKPITTGTYTLTPEQADNLLNNRMYINIHSADFPGGEIRGDIKKK